MTPKTLGPVKLGIKYVTYPTPVGGEMYSGYWNGKSFNVACANEYGEVRAPMETNKNTHVFSAMRTALGAV